MAITLIILGFCSLIWQFASLRELQTTFSGNELSLSIILFCWLAGSAIGAFVSRYLLWQRNALKNTPQKLSRLLGAILFLNSFLCFLSIFLIRSLKLFLGISPFEILQPLQMLLISSLATIPQTICIGISFILICALIQNPLKAYCREAFGAFLAGLLSLILLKYFNSWEIIWLCSSLFLLAIVCIKPCSRFFRAIAILTFIALTLLPPLGILTQLENYTNSLRFKPEHVIASLNSMYANIALTRSNQHYSLYENGKLSFTTEDTEALEEFAHMILLHHPQPKKILLIGGGTSGLLAEILKHPVESIEYLEPDEKLIYTSLRYIPQARGYGLTDKRVTLYHRDARSFIKTAHTKYDCVILNMADPSSLQQNRFFTVEFFQEIKRILNPDGTFSLALSSKEDILSGQILAYNTSLYKTAKSVFKNITILPGERLILICSLKVMPQAPPEELIQRFRERNITTVYFTPEYLHAKLFRQGYIQERLNAFQSRTALNQDYFPHGFFYYLCVWDKQSWLSFNRLWQATGRINFLYWGALILLLYFIFRRNTAKAVILTSGFTGIALEIIISFIFQINFGFLYYRLGVIVASFMLGLSLGSICSIYALKRSIPWKTIACSLEISLGIIAIALFFLLRQDQLVYFAATLLIGFLTGVEFGLFYNQFSAHTVYILDLTGACIGSLLTGLVIIPMLGIYKACIAIALTKFIALVFLRTQAR